MKHGKNYKVVRCAKASDCIAPTGVVLPPPSDDNDLLGRKIDGISEFNNFIEQEMYDHYSRLEAERERAGTEGESSGHNDDASDEE